MEEFIKSFTKIYGHLLYILTHSPKILNRHEKVKMEERLKLVLWNKINDSVNGDPIIGSNYTCKCQNHHLQILT